MKTVRKRNKKLGLAAAVCIAEFLIAAAMITIVKAGLQHVSLLAFGIFAISVVAICMAKPKESGSFVRKNSKAIYILFLLLVIPLLVFSAIAMASNAAASGHSLNAISQGLGALAALAVMFILTTEIIPYKELIGKVNLKKRVY